jgi:hypothetical protein
VNQTVGSVDRRFHDSNSKAALALRLALGGAAGLVFGLSILPWGFITGDGIFWQSQVSDRGAALIGYWYFVADAWRWPLYAVRSLNLPDGTSVIFTDSVPLIALAMKGLHTFGMPPWNFFGAWLLCCYALNGSAMALVLWYAEVRSVVLIILSALLAAGTPVLLHRFYHLALCGQFPILLAFALYVAVERARHPATVLRAAAFLVVVSLGLHPYICAMVFALYLATLARAAGGRITWRQAISHGALTCLVLAGLVLALGYVSLDGPRLAAGGFGQFSANLLSPFVSSVSGLNPQTWERLQRAEATGSVWPFFYPAWPDATGGQYYDGFGYLGLGLLLLCAVHVPYVIRNRTLLVRRHWPLTLVLSGAALYALSNRVYLGNFLVADVQLPFALSALFGVFRSSGRFLWLIIYGVIVAAAILTARRFGTRKGAAALAVALALQLVDTAPLRQAIAFDTGSPDTAGLEIPELRRWFSGGFDRLYVIPSYQCGDPDLGNRKLALQFLVARDGPIPTNSAGVARGRRECANELALLDEMVVGRRTAWVFFADGLALPAVEEFSRSSTVQCRPIGEILACARLE